MAAAAASPPSEERNGEIWSTRIQQELLSLTTDNGDMDAVTEARSMLPPFTTIKDHTLDMMAGTCIVSVQVDVKTSATSEDGEPITASVVVGIEACLATHDDGSVNPKEPAYPFVPPIARLTTGKEAFPAGSTIKEGDRIGMDLDWTPSLHLTDAILNIGLKIKESILQGEAFHPEPEPDLYAEAVDEVAKGAMRFASKISKKASSLRSKAFSPKAPSGGGGEQRSSPRSGGGPKPNKSPKIVTPADVKMGDELNLLEEPWDAAHGLYSAKAIRRPPFIEQVMVKPTKQKDQPSTPTSMFRSFAQSARSVMEETCIMVTDMHILEVRVSKLHPGMGTVAFLIPIELISKLKFRRQESLSLFFKTAPEDPLVYMCPDSGDAVHQIQCVLKQKGVRGKHTNAAAYRAINEAIVMVQEIQTKEMALEHEPTVERVNEIMDLYRQAAERFESAGDIRHEEVVTYMRKFLAKPTTMSILDGSNAKLTAPKEEKPATAAAAAASPSSPGAVPEGEILERVELSDDFGVEPTLAPERAEDKVFADSIDGLMKDAKEDFDFGIDDDDDEDNADPLVSSDADGDDIEGMAADLDAMMREADKELAELMNS